MKQTIKIKVLTPGCAPEIIKKGEWIDLRAAQTVKLKKGEYSLIPLGVAMKLPSGFEAVVAPRSSTFKNFNTLQTNSLGIIDNSYSGDSDEWKFPALATKSTEVKRADRICQFRIQLSQKATVWQKLKWLLSSGVKLEFVDRLSDTNRGGFGSTGIN